MDNPNNPWAYPPPPPPGYAPPAPVPPPPPQKGLFAPPQGKNRGLALAMVCLMALAHLASVLITNLNSSDLAAGLSLSLGPLQLAVPAVNLLLTLLVFLKCVLPGWEPHRKIFGWLLGAWAAGSLGSSVYGMIAGFRIMNESLVGSGFSGAFNAGFIGGAIGGAVGALYGIATSPQGILLFGVLAKKSTEKIAALVSAISFGLSVLLIPLGLLLFKFLAQFAETIDLPEILQVGIFESGVLWVSTTAGMILSLCWAIFLFTWPVLERPVLERKS